MMTDAKVIELNKKKERWKDARLAGEAGKIGRMERWSNEVIEC